MAVGAQEPQVLGPIVIKQPVSMVNVQDERSPIPHGTLAAKSTLVLTANLYQASSQPVGLLPWL